MEYQLTEAAAATSCAWKSATEYATDNVPEAGHYSAADDQPLTADAGGSTHAALADAAHATHAANATNETSGAAKG